MGAIGGLLGMAGGINGTGIQGPQQAAIQAGVGPSNVIASGQQNQAALNQQQALVAALQGQGGIGNQSQVYNQLQGLVSGTGPNPAQAQLAQNTAANVAQTGALMAGQRGAGQNVGLLARQAGQQGAATQQGAAGQAATLQAQQQLGAMQAAGTLAGQQVGQQIGATQAYTGAQQANQQTLQQALAALNQANVSSQASVNAANAGLANTTMQGQQALIGGLGNAAGAGIGSLGGSGGTSLGGLSATPNASMTGTPAGATEAFAYGGGQVHMDNGGMAVGNQPQQGPQSFFGQYLNGQKQNSGPFQMGGNQNNNQLQSGITNLGKGIFGAMKKGGMVSVVVSPGEKLVPPSKVKEAAGGKVQAKTVPGKAEVKGDSLKNDKVPMKLPEGTVVIPRTKAKGNEKESGFVRDTLAKRRRK